MRQELHVRAQKENVTSTLSVHKLCLPSLSESLGRSLGRGGDPACQDTTAFFYD